MATLGEQAKLVHDDQQRQHTRRFRLVIDQRDNGHKIEHHYGEWFVLEDGMIEEKQIRFALERMLEKGFTHNGNPS